MPGCDEPSIRAVLLFTSSEIQPLRISEAPTGRPGRPGPSIEDPAVLERDRRPAVRRRPFVHSVEGGRNAGTEHAGLWERPAVDMAILDHQRGAHVVLEL